MYVGPRHPGSRPGWLAQLPFLQAQGIWPLVRSPMRTGYVTADGRFVFTRGVAGTWIVLTNKGCGAAEVAIVKALNAAALPRELYVAIAALSGALPAPAPPPQWPSLARTVLGLRPLPARPPVLLDDG